MAIFQDEDIDGVYAVKNGKVTRVLTGNTSVEVPLGVLTDYLNNGGKYKVGYRVIYSPVGDDSSLLIQDELNGKDGWKLIQENGSDIWFSRTTLKLDQVAPVLAPIVSSLTDKSVVLTSSAGTQITLSNGETKASGSTWSGLSVVTAYSAYAYYPSDATHNQSPNSGTTNFTTLKSEQVAPSVPIATGITANSAILTSSAGAQITSNGTTKVSGSTWTGLTPGSNYTAYAFYLSDATHNQSPNSANVNYTTLKADQTAPVAPTAIGITSYSVILVSSMGSQITCNGETKASGSTWSGLSVVTEYSAYAYYPADTTYNQSPNSGITNFTTLKADQLAPTVPIYTDVTTTTVVLTSSAGSQITCNGLTKVSGSTWTSLSPATDYTAFAYLPGDATHNQSPNSGSTGFTTLKLSRSAPIDPVASSITSSGVVLTSSAGSQITCNGDTRASGSTWSGLFAATSYTAFAYIPSDVTHYQSPNSGTIGFTTLKLDQTAPVAPTAIGVTSNSVILVSAMGSQITCNGETKASGSTWSSLSAGTSYAAYAFYAATSTYNQSPNSVDTNFTTLKADQLAPTVPTVTGTTTTTAVLTSSAGSMITSNGVTQASGSTWTGLTPGPVYTAYAYMPEDATHNQSPNSANANYTTLKLDQVAPTTPVASSITTTTVVLTSSAGSQITSNGSTKASGSTWSSLTPGSTYSALAYMPEDATHNQSPNSASVNYTTLKLDQVAPTTPVASSITTTTVVLTSSAGSQITSNGVTKASGSTWSSLTSGSTYSALAFMPEDATHNQSPNSASVNYTILKLNQVAPTTPVASSITTTTVVLTSSVGSSITSNGVMQASGSTWSILTPGSTYSALAFMPADATHNQSPNSASVNYTMLKLDQVAPSVPVASGLTATTVVLTSSEGSSITSNGVTQASGSTWLGLSVATAYTALAFMPADATHNQSPNSANANYTTLCYSQSAPTVPIYTGVTATTVVLTSTMGSQITLNGVTKASGSTWSGLSPGTAYTAFAYMPADATHYQSPNSANADFTTLKLEQVAPTVPIASSITTTSVVLTSSAGSQITSNGVTKASGSTWSGLSVATAYTAFAYLPSDATHYQSPNSANANYTTLKLDQVAPATPVASSITTTTVVLTSSAGSQITSNGVTKVSGSTWSSLTPGSTYSALAYMPSDATHNQSPDSASVNYTLLKLSQVAPLVPVASSITTTTVVLTSSAGSQITSNGVTQASGSTWSGLTPGSTYSALAYMPADATHNQSPNSASVNYTMLKLSQVAPTVPVASGLTATTVVLTSSVGSSITCNGVTQASGSTWSGLSAATAYTALAYMSSDATHNQSPNSANANFTTLKLDQVAPIVPVASDITTTTVVLTSSAGSQITSNGVTQASGSTWSGLSVATAYTAYSYMPSDATHNQSLNSANANYTTLKLNQSAPSVPVASGFTDTTVVLTSSAGSQITSNGLTQASGSTWSGLSPITDYTAFAFMPSDATHYQSPNSANANYTTLKLAQAAPSTPVPSVVTATSVTLTSSAGSQITSNGVTMASGSTWTGLAPATAYTAFAYMPADATHNQSPNSANANYTTLSPTVSKPIITSIAGTSPTGDPTPNFAPTTTIKVDFITTGIIDTATIYLKQSGQADKVLGAAVVVTSDGSGNATVSQQVTLASSTIVNLAANVYVKGTNTSIAVTVTSLDSNPFTPTNPIAITPTIDGPIGSAVLTGAGYSGHYPGKTIQIGSGTDGFVSALRATDTGGASTTFSTQVNSTGYWRNTWPSNGLPQNFTISATSTWDANYSVTTIGNTPFIDTTTGLSQTATGTKVFKLDPKLTISTATAIAVVSTNQTDGKIHPSYPDHSYVNNTVKLDATTTGFSNGMIATVYSPSMAVLGTVTLNINSGANLNTTTWTNTWAVPEDLETGTYTFRFSATAHDGQPSVTRDATASAVRDIAVTSVSDTIPAATAWLYPSAQPSTQVYPGQVIDLSANTIGEAQSVSVQGSDGSNGPGMTTTDKTLYTSTWSSTFTIPDARKIGENYTLTFTATDKYGATNTRTLVLVIQNPLGIVPASISVTPYDAGQGPNPAPTAKLKVTMQLYGWVTSARLNWPVPNNELVTLTKTAGPDARGITTWSTDSNGIVVPHDVACGYPDSPVAPVSAPINLSLTVSGSSGFTNADNSANSFSDSTTNVPISDNVKITSFTTSVDYANIGDTILLTAITTGFAESVSVEFPWDVAPVVLTNSFGLPSPYQGIWTANYTIPGTAVPAPGSPYTVTATATNTFNVMPPAGSTEISTATTQLTISSLTLDMFGPATAHRGDTLTLWGTTTGKAESVKLVSVSPSIPYVGTGTLVSSLDFASLLDPATSEINTWYSDQAHANGWVVPNDIEDETILTLTFEAADALGLKKQDTLQVRIVPIIVVITH